MSLTLGQKEYLLELLSHEYVLSAEQQPAVRQAICRYATTVYSRQELDTLLTMPQSLAICLYYHCNRQAFAKQYGLWLNCLEHAIYQEMDGMEAVIINPDPTGCEKLLALTRQADGQLIAEPLPQLRFVNQPKDDCSRWTLQEAQASMRQFLQFAYQANSCQQEAEALSWTVLYQHAQLFPLVKETYLFIERAAGLPKPSNWKQLQQLSSPSNKPTIHHPVKRQSWIYQPPADPFAAEKKLIKQIKNSFTNLHQNRPIPMPNLPKPPIFPSQIRPPFSFRNCKSRPI